MGSGPWLVLVWWQTHPCLVLPASDTGNTTPQLALLGSCLAVVTLPQGSSLVSPQNDSNLLGSWTLTQQWESRHLLANDWLPSGVSVTYAPPARAPPCTALVLRFLLLHDYSLVAVFWVVLAGWSPHH